MTVAEKVRETASEVKDDLRETVRNLKDEVAQLKGKLGEVVPLGRKRSAMPVRREADTLTETGRWPWLLDDQWFDLAWPGRRWARLFDRSLFEEWPQVDVTDGDREIRVRAELPGVESDDVDVTVSGTMLTIRGEKRSETEDRGHGHYRHECQYGSFERTIPLPCEVDREGVEAKFRKGVLTVTLPKTREARQSVRRVPVGKG